MFHNIDELKEKKLMALVIMMIIMILCLILIITTFTLEFFGNGNLGGSGNILLNVDTNDDGLPDINITYGNIKDKAFFNIDERVIDITNVIMI